MKFEPSRGRCSTARLWRSRMDTAALSSALQLGSSGAPRTLTHACASVEHSKRLRLDRAADDPRMITASPLEISVQLGRHWVVCLGTSGLNRRTLFTPCLEDTRKNQGTVELETSNCTRNILEKTQHTAANLRPLFPGSHCNSKRAQGNKGKEKMYIITRVFLA